MPDYVDHRQREDCIHTKGTTGVVIIVTVTALVMVDVTVTVTVTALVMVDVTVTVTVTALVMVDVIAVVFLSVRVIAIVNVMKMMPITMTWLPVTVNGFRQQLVLTVPRRCSSAPNVPSVDWGREDKKRVKRG